MESVAIYGNAVKIQEKREKSAAIENAGKVEHLVKSGEKVRMRVCKNGVMVETSATALQQGKRGESIRLQLQNSRKVNARVSSKGEVEVWL
jgi:flagella basal body P-ring formation protein FlgA